MKVIIREVLEREVKVESVDEAESLYKAGTIVLDYRDLRSWSIKEKKDEKSKTKVS